MWLDDLLKWCLIWARLPLWPRWPGWPGWPMCRWLGWSRWLEWPRWPDDSKLWTRLTVFIFYNSYRIAWNEYILVAQFMNNKQLKSPCFAFCYLQILNVGCKPFHIVPKNIQWWCPCLMYLMSVNTEHNKWIIILLLFLTKSYWANSSSLCRCELVPMERKRLPPYSTTGTQPPRK